MELKAHMAVHHSSTNATSRASPTASQASLWRIDTGCGWDQRPERVNAQDPCPAKIGGWPTRQNAKTPTPQSRIKSCIAHSRLHSPSATSASLASAVKTPSSPASSAPGHPLHHVNALLHPLSSGASLGTSPRSQIRAPPSPPPPRGWPELPRLALRSVVTDAWRAAHGPEDSLFWPTRNRRAGKCVLVLIFCCKAEFSHWLEFCHPRDHSSAHRPAEWLLKHLTLPPIFLLFSSLSSSHQ